MLESKDVL